MTLVSRRSCSLSAVLFLSLFTAASLSRGATLLWDATSATAGAQDGGGTWNIGPNWRNTVTPADNQSFANADTVTFGAGSGVAGTVTVNQSGGVSTASITFNAAGSGNYTIAGSGATGTITMTAGTITANVDATISAIIGGTSLTKAGAGKLILSGANTYTGLLDVTAGVVNLQNAAAAGTTAGGVTVRSGAALELQGGLSYGSETLTLNGSGVSSTGALRNISGSNTWAGAVTLASASQISADAGALTISGTLSGAFALTVTSGASANLTFNGALQTLTALNLNLDATSTLTFGSTSNNSFTGATSLNAGTLALNKTTSSDSQLPQAIANNATLNIGNGTAAAIVRLDRSQQIGDTGTVLNFSGTGATAGILRMNGQSDVVGTVKSATAGAGIIENNHATTASTLTVNNSTNDTFSGLIRNGAAAALNLAKSNTGTLTLTGTASYTGTTSVRNGTLEIASATSLATSTGYQASTGGVLKLTNTSSSNVADRLANGVAVSLSGGTVWLADDGSTAAYTETIGAVQLTGGASTLSTVSSAAGSTVLTAASLTRARGATLTFSGTNLGTSAANRILFTTAPATTDNGLIGGWAVTGNEFAKYDASNGVTALTAGDYVAAGETAWTFDSNAKQTTSTTLTADRRVNSLNLQQGSATTLNLGGNTLRVESGGVLVSGAFNSVISNGTLIGGTSSNSAGELIIHQQSANPMDITAVIADNGTRATTLVKSGTGTVKLSGANTLTGGVFINAGILQLGGANALGAGNVSTNAVALEGGTLDLNGFDLTVGAFSSQANNTAGTVTNSAGGTKTLTVGNGGGTSTFNGQIANSGVNFTKTGSGVLTFNQQNASYAGITTVAAGTLKTGGPNALGISGTDASRTIVQAGATLDISAGINRNERLEIAGFGVDGLGAIVANSGDSQNIQYATLTGHTTLGVNVRYDFDSTLIGGGYNLTKIGSAELALEGGSVAGLGDVHIKQGTITWSGTADLGVATNTLYVDSGAAAQFYNHQDDSKLIVLGGGTLRRAGTDNTTGREIDAAGGGITLNAGASSILHSGSALVFQLNTIDRKVGATVNLDTSANLATTDTTLTAGIIGGYMTLGNADWATKASDTADGVISAYTGYAGNDFATSTNNVTVSGAQGPSNFTVNSLRFNAASTTLTLTGENIVSSGGVLVTGSGTSASITGGTLKGSASGDLVVINFANFSIASVIADNGGATALTKSGGTGNTLTLSGSNTYSGGTFINAGTLSVSLIADSGSSNLGGSTGGSNGLTFNGGATLAYTGSVDTTTGRDVKVLSGGGAIDVAASRTLTLTGVISGEAALTGEGTYVNEAKFTKAGTGTLTLAGTSANTLAGITEITAGTLRLSKTDGVNAIAGNVTIGNNAGGLDILLLGASNQIADTSVLTLNGTTTNAGIFRLAGQSETVGGLSSTGGAGIVENESGAANTSTVAVNTATGATLTFTGVMRNGDGSGTDGTLAFTKTGAGTQVLTGANTYTGATTVSGGSLQLGAGGTTGSIASTSGIAFSNGANLTVNRSDAVTISQTMTGSGSFVQAGSGTTTLSNGASDYSGTTEVNAGTLVVTNTSGSATGVSTVWVNGATLAGTGIISGNTTVREGGVLTPGVAGVANGIGTLSFGGDLTLKRGTTSSAPLLTLQLGTSTDTVFNDAAGISANSGNLAAYFATQTATYEAESGVHDRLNVGGTLHLDAGAVLAVDNTLGYTLKFGDVLDLIDWTSLDASAAAGDRDWTAGLDLQLPTLGGGLSYDLSLFSTSGIVVVVPEPGRMSLLLLAAGGLLLRRRRASR